MKGIVEHYAKGEFQVDRPEIEISEEGGKLTIRPTEAETNININLKTMDASKYPEIHNCNESLYFSLPQKDYVELIEKTAFAASEDNSRFFLTGVFMEKKDEKLVLSGIKSQGITYLSRSSVQKCVDGLSKRKYRIRIVEEDEEL